MEEVNVVLTKSIAKDVSQNLTGEIVSPENAMRVEDQI